LLRAVSNPLRTEPFFSAWGDSPVGGSRLCSRRPWFRRSAISWSWHSR
jgi:hypothetical protein